MCTRYHAKLQLRLKLRHPGFANRAERDGSPRVLLEPDLPKELSVRLAESSHRLYHAGRKGRAEGMALSHSAKGSAPKIW